MERVALPLALMIAFVSFYACSQTFSDEGQTALAQGRLDDAVRQVTAAVNADPGNLQLRHFAAEVFTRRGIQHYNNHEMLAAANDFQTATQYDPMYGPAYDYLGMIAFWKHDWQNAVDLGTHASMLEGRPDPPWVEQARQELDKIKNGGASLRPDRQNASSKTVESPTTH